MSCIRTICLLSAILLANPVVALPTGSSDRAELFAVCSGRLEALAAHERARHGDEAGSLTQLQHEFDQMLDAILPWALSEGVEEHQPKRWRVRGLVEVAHLLADMDYSFDSRIAAGAERQLTDRMSECRKVLL